MRRSSSAKMEATMRTYPYYSEMVTIISNEYSYNSIILTLIEQILTTFLLKSDQSKRFISLGQ